MINYSEMENITTSEGLLTEQEIAEVQPQVGQEVKFRFVARPEVFLQGRMIRISPAGARKINLPALTSLGEGTIMVDARTQEALEPYYELIIIIDESNANHLRYGMTGRIKLKTAAKPIGFVLIKKVLRFLNNLNQ